MAKYSRIYKVGKRSFRYNYDECLLEWISKPSKEELADMLADNAERAKEGRRPLWNSDDLAGVVDQIGLSLENWKDDPQHWCERWSEDINECLRWIM